MGKSWKAGPATAGTLREFNDEFSELCAKHKVLASSVVLVMLGERVGDKFGLYVEILGDQKMVAMTKQKFGIKP